jgi:hypothetical protein
MHCQSWLGKFSKVPFIFHAMSRIFSQYFLWFSLHPDAQLRWIGNNSNLDHNITFCKGLLWSTKLGILLYDKLVLGCNHRPCIDSTYQCSTNPHQSRDSECGNAACTTRWRCCRRLIVLFDLFFFSFFFCKTRIEVCTASMLFVVLFAMEPKSSNELHSKQIWV